MTELKENFEKYASAMANEAYPLVGEYGWMSLDWSGTQDVEDILNQIKSHAMSQVERLLTQGGYHRVGALSKEGNSATYIRGGMGGRIIRVGLQTAAGNNTYIHDRYSAAMQKYRNALRDHFDIDCEFALSRNQKPYSEGETLRGFFQWDFNPGNGLRYVVMNAMADIVVSLDRSQIRHIVELYGNMDMADFEEVLINYESN